MSSIMDQALAQIARLPTRQPADTDDVRTAIQRSTRSAFNAGVQVAKSLRNAGDGLRQSLDYACTMIEPAIGVTVARARAAERADAGARLRQLADAAARLARSQVRMRDTLLGDAGEFEPWPEMDALAAALDALDPLWRDARPDDAGWARQL